MSNYFVSQGLLDERYLQEDPGFKITAQCLSFSTQPIQAPVQQVPPECSQGNQMLRTPSHTSPGDLTPTVQAPQDLTVKVAEAKLENLPELVTEYYYDQSGDKKYVPNDFFLSNIDKNSAKVTDETIHCYFCKSNFIYNNI